MSESSNSNRERLKNESFDYLMDILTVSRKKFDMNEKRDDTRLKWGRLGVQAIQAYGSLQQLTKLEELAHDVEMIKVKIGLKV